MKGKFAHYLPNATKVMIASVSALMLSLAVTTSVATADEEVYEDRSTWSEKSRRFFSDGWKEGKVETAIVLNENLSNFDIDTEVKGDTAYLTGVVASEAQKALAEDIALSVKGIEQVDNALQVSASALEEPASDEESRSFRTAITDASITANVKTRLLADSEVPAMSIDVDTANGVVALKGIVANDSIKKKAEQIAAGASNVESVDNQLEVADN